MLKQSLRVGILLTGIVLLAQGCNQEPAGPAADAPPLPQSAMVYSSAGYWVPVEQMRTMLNDVTQAVAVALADPRFRTLVHDEMQASAYPEKKLHLRSFLSGSGSDMLAAIAIADNITTDAVLAQLDSLLDLEFYMPVRAHRDVWKGGPDLLVATTLFDDGTIPSAFNLSGSPVQLSSATTPPATPTLAVVPAETDFSRPPVRSSMSLSTSSQALMASVDTGIVMTYASVPGDYEGFLMGDPEFEMHVFVQDESGDLEDQTCAGEQANSPFNYDHDNVSWVGEVLLFPAPVGDTA